MPDLNKIIELFEKNFVPLEHDCRGSASGIHDRRLDNIIEALNQLKEYQCQLNREQYIPGM